LQTSAWVKLQSICIWCFVEYLNWHF
jgi:hypothetical protein